MLRAMPFAYPYPAHLKLDILARIAAGEHLTRVCEDAGLPTYGAVRLWTRADPAFAADLAEARRVGDWRRRFTFRDSVAKALIGRLIAGEGIVAVLRDPAMPSRAVYAYWRATQPEFAGEVYRVKELRAEQRLARNKARARPFDPVIADRLLARVLRGEPIGEVRNDPAMPSGTLITRWRRENREFGRILTGALAIAAANRRGRNRPSRRCTDALTTLIMHRILAGATLASLGREPDMPCAATLYGWKRKNPEFARAVAIGRMGYDDRKADMRMEAMGWGGPIR
jgi:hypothetical protein